MSSPDDAADATAPRHRAPGEPDDAPKVPGTNRGLMVLAGVLLLVPIVALCWVPSYNQVTPELWGFPFFYWYQFLWVFLCAGFTASAYAVTKAARR